MTALCSSNFGLKGDFELFYILRNICSEYVELDYIQAKSLVLFQEL